MVGEQAVVTRDDRKFVRPTTSERGDVQPGAQLPEVVVADDAHVRFRPDPGRPAVVETNAINPAHAAPLRRILAID